MNSEQVHTLGNRSVMGQGGDRTKQAPENKIASQNKNFTAALIALKHTMC